MFDATSLAGELIAAGYTFGGYAEDLPSAEYTGCKVGGYARKHSPWTDFRDVPAAADQPLSAMPSDYANLPTVSFLIPNLCHDMHDCSIAEGDRWLAQNIDHYATWSRTHNSLLVVTFDESENDPDNPSPRWRWDSESRRVRSLSGPTTIGSCARWRTSTGSRRSDTARRPLRSAGCGVPKPRSAS